MFVYKLHIFNAGLLKFGAILGYDLGGELLVCGRSKIAKFESPTKEKTCFRRTMLVKILVCFKEATL